MQRTKPQPVSDVREFFSEELRSVIEKRRMTVKKDSYEYLVNLLVAYMDSNRFFAKDEDGKLKNNVLADLYANYVYGDAKTKVETLRRLGDICLLVTGLFPDSLNKKIVDIDYYFGMGGTAYLQLSRMQFTALARTLYGELSVNFRDFSDVLGEMSDRSGLQSNSDLLRLYEKFLITGSDRLKALLSEKGILALPVDVKVRH